MKPLIRLVVFILAVFIVLIVIKCDMASSADGPPGEESSRMDGMAAVFTEPRPRVSLEADVLLNLLVRLREEMHVSSTMLERSIKDYRKEILDEELRSIATRAAGKDCDECDYAAVARCKLAKAEKRLQLVKELEWAIKTLEALQ